MPEIATLTGNDVPLGIKDSSIPRRQGKRYTPGDSKHRIWVCPRRNGNQFPFFVRMQAPNEDGDCVPGTGFPRARRDLLSVHCRSGCSEKLGLRLVTRAGRFNRYQLIRDGSLPC